MIGYLLAFNSRHSGMECRHGRLSFGMFLQRKGHPIDLNVKNRQNKQTWRGRMHRNAHISEYQSLCRRTRKFQRRQAANWQLHFELQANMISTDIPVVSRRVPDKCHLLSGCSMSIMNHPDSDHSA
jgi:hypothetical protein